MSLSDTNCSRSQGLNESANLPVLLFRVCSLILITTCNQRKQRKRKILCHLGKYEISNQYYLPGTRYSILYTPNSILLHCTRYTPYSQLEQTGQYRISYHRFAYSVIQYRWVYGIIRQQDRPLCMLSDARYFFDENRTVKPKPSNS
jgi:hypothetical protein